jgi:hypothetical protein
MFVFWQHNEVIMAVFELGFVFGQHKEVMMVCICNLVRV